MADSEKTFPDSHSAPGRAADTRYSVSRRQGFRQLRPPRGEALTPLLFLRISFPLRRGHAEPVFESTGESA